MCDTFVLRTDAGTVLAKNSDRDPNEAQLWEWTAAADHAEGATASTTYVEVPQVARTHADRRLPPLVDVGRRDGRQRARRRDRQRGGLHQGADQPRAGPARHGPAAARARAGDDRGRGRRGHRRRCSRSTARAGRAAPSTRKFTYHNSFLVADRDSAVVLETAGRQWATEQVTGSARSISNGLTIPGFAEKYADRLRGRVAACDDATDPHPAPGRRRRGDRARRCASCATTAPGAARAGRRSPARWSAEHARRRLVASSQTVSSWVSDLGTGVHWATGSADPAFSLFVPLRVDRPVGEDAYPTAGVDNRPRRALAVVARTRTLHRRALRD